MAYRRWIWCKDTTTGHHFDVDERQLARLVKAKAVELVEGYPVNEGQDARPRPTKPNARLTVLQPGQPQPEPEAATPDQATGRRATRTTAARSSTTEGVDQ